MEKHYSITLAPLVVFGIGFETVGWDGFPKDIGVPLKYDNQIFTIGD